MVTEVVEGPDVGADRETEVVEVEVVVVEIEQDFSLEESMLDNAIVFDDTSVFDTTEVFEEPTIEVVAVVMDTPIFEEDPFEEEVSEEELEILGETRDKTDALKKLHEMGSKYIAVTLGSKGTLISNGKDKKIIPSIKIRSIDSTGAGDAFVGGVLYKISQRKNYNISFEEMCEIIKFSNKVGAITCKTIGAISSLPTLEEVERLEEDRSE